MKRRWENGSRLHFLELLSGFTVGHSASAPAVLVLLHALPQGEDYVLTQGFTKDSSFLWKYLLIRASFF